jgi:hypothetical protein
MQRHAILATAHLQQGDLEGACAVGRRVIEEARGLSSTRTLDDVTHLVRLVNASGAGLPAREFTEQARALLKPGRRLLDRDDLKRLGKVAGRQPGSLTVRNEPLTQVLLERGPMGGLALVGPDRGQLPPKGVGDVDVVVRARGPHQPHLADHPRLQPLLPEQLGMGERVAVIGEVRAQDRLANRPVIRMVPMEPPPAPLRRPGQHPLGPHLADHRVMSRRSAQLGARRPSG